MNIRNGKNYNYVNMFIGFTGDEQIARKTETGNISASYSLEQFKRYFSKNDISVLKDIFLNLDMDFCDYFYDYDKHSEKFWWNFSNKQEELDTRKYMDEIYSAVTDVYARLYKGLSIEYKSKVLKDFTKILTVMNITNYRIVQFNTDKSVSGVNRIFNINKYVKQFHSSEFIQQRAINNSIKELDNLFSGKYGELNSSDWGVEYNGEIIQQLKNAYFGIEEQKTKNELEEEKAL